MPATFGNLACTSAADLLASTAARSLVEGTSFGGNILKQLPSAIANTIGGVLASELQPGDPYRTGAPGEDIIVTGPPRLSIFDLAPNTESLDELNTIVFDAAATVADFSTDMIEMRAQMAQMRGRLERLRNTALQAMVRDIKRSYGPTYEDMQILYARNRVGEATHFDNVNNSGRSEDAHPITVDGEWWDATMNTFGSNRAVGPGCSAWHVNVDVTERANAAVTNFDQNIGELLIFSPKAALQMVGEVPNLLINGVDYATGRITFNEAMINSIPMGSVFTAERGLARIGQEGMGAEREAIDLGLDSKRYSLDAPTIAGLEDVGGSIQAFRPVHRNSLSYVGDTHVYVIRGPDGSLYKIGESAQGVRVDDGASIRAEQQARALQRQTGNTYRTEVRQNLASKAEARAYETRFIQTYARLFGRPPGNPSDG